jgi:benzoyl-CoA reductase/2-hydroxyglutaryl-CoA dehydratase subunit BcrC/BadD/HgdB
VSVLRRIRDALPDLFATCAKARDQGREVVGTFTPLAPPAELIEAAGARPFRLLMTGGPDADLKGMSLLGRDTCTFCRSVLGSAVVRAEPVTCIVVGTTCDRLRRAGDAFHGATGLPVFTLSIPRTREVPGQIAALADELGLLARELSARTGVEAEKDRLHRAIEDGNRAREILWALDRARRDDPPRLTGSEFLDVVRAAHGLPAAEFLAIVSGVIEEVAARAPVRKRPVRILLVGPTLPDGTRDVLDIAEDDHGAVVVADLTDSGTLGYGGPIEIDGDPFAALAGQLLAHPVVTAPLRPATAFRDAFTRAIEESRPEGVIFRGVPFCRPFNAEAVALRRLSPVPFLDVRVESTGGMGQLRTRVGAFIESIEARRGR